MKTTIEKFQIAALKFRNDERAMQMGEYAVIGALILVAAFAAFSVLGSNIGAKITEIAGHI